MALAIGMIILLLAGVLILLHTASGAEGGDIEVSGFVEWPPLQFPLRAWLPLVQGVGAPCPTPTATPTPDLTAIEAKVAEMINNRRRMEGLGDLAIVPGLIGASRVHSQDMATNSFFGHTGSDGSTPPVRMQRPDCLTVTTGIHQSPRPYYILLDCVASAHI
ncbi:MAG: CAP domain-containing protein [Chloroflexi bacterium]|nr:CAP domain-containing protein [Chloroflexota bacterium]